MSSCCRLGKFNGCIQKRWVDACIEFSFWNRTAAIVASSTMTAIQKLFRSIFHLFFRPKVFSSLCRLIARKSRTHRYKWKRFICWRIFDESGSGFRCVFFWAISLPSSIKCCDWLVDSYDSRKINTKKLFQIVWRVCNGIQQCGRSASLASGRTGMCVCVSAWGCQEKFCAVAPIRSQTVGNCTRSRKFPRKIHYIGFSVRKLWGMVSHQLMHKVEIGAHRPPRATMQMCIYHAHTTGVPTSQRTCDYQIDVAISVINEQCANEEKLQEKRKQKIEKAKR